MKGTSYDQTPVSNLLENALITERRYDHYLWSISHQRVWLYETCHCSVCWDHAAEPNTEFTVYVSLRDTRIPLGHYIQKDLDLSKNRGLFLFRVKGSKKGICVLCNMGLSLRFIDRKWSETLGLWGNCHSHSWPVYWSSHRLWWWVRRLIFMPW